MGCARAQPEPSSHLLWQSTNVFATSQPQFDKTPLIPSTQVSAQVLFSSIFRMGNLDKLSRGLAEYWFNKAFLLPTMTLIQFLSGHSSCAYWWQYIKLALTKTWSDSVKWPWNKCVKHSSAQNEMEHLAGCQDVENDINMWNVTGLICQYAY